MPDPLLNKLLLAPASTPAATSGRPSPAAGSASAGGDSFSNALERRMSAAEREPARTRAVATGRGPERREAPPLADRDRGRELRREEHAATADRAQEVQPRIDRDAPAEAANATSAGDGETGSEDRASAVEVQQQPTSALVPAAESVVPSESTVPPPDAGLTASFAGLVPAPATVLAEGAAVAGDQAVSAPVLQDGIARASAVPLLEKLIAEVTAAPGEAHGGSGERLNVAGRSAQGDANRGLAALLPARVEAQLPDAAGAIPGLPGDAVATGGPATSVPGAGFNAAVRSEPVAQLPVHTPAGQQRAWAEEIGNRVVWLVGRNESKAELVLTPPQMGKLEVSIHVSGDQTIAHFVAATSAARDALEQAMPRLREMMQQAGISLGETSVGTSGGQQAGQENPSGRHARGPASGAASGSGETGAPLPMSVDWSRAGTGRVDTFA